MPPRRWQRCEWDMSPASPRSSHLLPSPASSLYPLLTVRPASCVPCVRPASAPLAILAKYRGRARRQFSSDFTEPTPFSIYISYSTIKTADIAVFTSSHTSPASPLYLSPLRPLSLHALPPSPLSPAPLHCSTPCSSRALSSCYGTMLLYVPRRR